MIEKLEKGDTILFEMQYFGKHNKFKVIYVFSTLYENSFFLKNEKPYYMTIKNDTILSYSYIPYLLIEKSLKKQCKKILTIY